VSEDLTAWRRFFAEEIQAVVGIKTAALVEALATVPRERFLRKGPWLVLGVGDLGGAPRMTPDADPRHVYHNLSIAIDAERMLFNGAPGVVVTCLEALGLRPGDRLLHVGCGLGYYTALAALCVGPSGRVLSIEVDERLAAEAAANLKAFEQVEVRPGDGTDLRDESFDAILVNAGVTHPHEAWLGALAAKGRMVLPLTFTTPQPPATAGTGPARTGPPAGTGSLTGSGPTIGKGPILLFTADGEAGSLAARVVTMVAIYSAVGIRDAAMNDQLAKAFMKGAWPAIRRLRRDPHEAAPSCCLHCDTFCLSAS